MKIWILCFLLFTSYYLLAQTVTVSIDVNSERKAISPLIYGMNNALSDNPNSPRTSAEWLRLRDAGVKMVRELGGNNGTKYNWRLKLSSHPDWYNNVYDHDWNFAAQSLQTNLLGVQGMWCFQLIGKAASNKAHNFDDWGYNKAQWWSGVHQNLAGGGVINNAGGDYATVNGNPDLYLMNWTADSTTKILDYWFNSLSLNKKYLKYWSMDNEPEIWLGPHDDVMPTQLSAPEFMQKYFEVAKKARAAYPEIKIMGPVPCNEWQWYNWNNNSISYNGNNYCWLEFFIKRIAEEQTASGVRLLDVLDIHFYPDFTTADDILQMHRAFFDDTYIYPAPNGVRRVNGGWDGTQNKEYIFKRCNDWLTKYLGANHGVTLSLSEMDVQSDNTNVVANWYASMLGTFAKNNVEIFTPWSWKKGMWEVLNLFSNYAKPTSIKATSGNELYLSSYASANAANDSVTLILVNRSQTATYLVNTQISNFNLQNGNYKTLTLSSLPSSETFVSKNSNALVASQSAVNGGTLSVSMPPLSIKAIILTSGTTGIINTAIENKSNSLTIKYIHNRDLRVEYKLEKESKLQIKLIDISGREIMKIVDKQQPSGIYQFDIYKGQLPEGIYVVSVSENNHQITSTKIKL